MSKQIQDLRAKYNAGGNAVIPNTFQHPNIFIDKLMYFLSPVENVVLTFAVRRILGFQSNIMSRKDNISLSQFTDGITAEDGSALSLGCGIGLEATVNALESLCYFKILLPTTKKPDPKKGQEYWLQDNENNIDWNGLEKRKTEKLEKYRQQTKKARCSVQHNPSVEQNLMGDVEQNLSPLLNRDTKPTETHRNPKRTAAKTPKQPLPEEIKIFREVTERFPNKINYLDVASIIQGVSRRLGRDCTAEDLRPFYAAWCGRGFNPTNLAWLSWAEKDVIPQNDKGGERKPISEPKGFEAGRKFLERVSEQ